jgi:hypothetical protein
LETIGDRSRECEGAREDAIEEELTWERSRVVEDDLLEVWMFGREVVIIAHMPTG